MEAALIVATSGAATAVSALGAIEIRERQRRHRSWLTVELRFGREVTPETVLLVLDRIAGLHLSRAVAFEVLADQEGVHHLLSSDRGTLDTLRGSFRALLPSLRLLPASPPAAANWRSGRSLRLRGRLGTLRDDAVPETSAALLAAVQPLARGEQLRIRWLIRPGRVEQVPRVEHGVAVEPEDRRRLRVKNASSIVRARGTVAVRASQASRAAHLLSRLTSVIRSRSTAYGQLQARPRNGWQLRHELSRRSFLRGDRLAAAELVGLLAWPVSAPALPGVTLGTSPLLMPARRLPRSGRVLGEATWPGEERPIAQPLVGALSHSLIAGPTGVGKSTLLLNLMLADVRAGRGLVLIDGKGDTVSALLARIPKDRQRDVIVLDCASAGPLPGIRLFGDSDPGLAADVVLGVLADLFKDNWGPLSERYLRAGLVAVAHDPAGTLADVPYVYADPNYRRQLVGRLRDPLIRSTFAAFDAMSAAERQHQLAAPLNKLGQLLGRPVVRTVLGQPEPQLDFREALEASQIVVISLAPLRVGASASRLIGAVGVFALFQAVLGRGALPETARRPFNVYIDEPRALGDLPMPLDALLEQARGLGVGLTLAPQSITQLPKPVRQAALTNVATRVVFRQNAEDAGLLARDLPGVSADELQELAAYEAVARIGLGPGDIAPPVTIRTVPAPAPYGDGDRLRQASAQRYGRSSQEVDEALEARHLPSIDQAPVGRKRRTS